jgi:hypothetical protein
LLGPNRVGLTFPVSDRSSIVFDVSLKQT